MPLKISFNGIQQLIFLVENQRKEILRLKECLEQCIFYNQANPMFNISYAQQVIESLNILDRNASLKIKFLREAIEDFMFVKAEMHEIMDNYN